MKESQISAFVSETTKDLLERHVRATGVKKGHLVEAALRHHLAALHELPADIVIQPRVVVSEDAAEIVLGKQTGRKPTKGLKDLMSS